MSSPIDCNTLNHQFRAAMGDHGIAVDGEIIGDGRLHCLKVVAEQREGTGEAAASKEGAYCNLRPTAFSSFPRIS